MLSLGVFFVLFIVDFFSNQEIFQGTKSVSRRTVMVMCARPVYCRMVDLFQITSCVGQAENTELSETSEMSEKISEKISEMSEKISEKISEMSEKI